MEEKNMENTVCECCRHKHTPRDEETVRSLQNRLSRIIGQLGGIKNMLDDNRYCGDILIQTAAAEKALQSFGYLIFKEHMETCVAEEIRNGNDDVIDEAVELIRKLK
jgi:DNA-binding FrmR family transcriptional regulator